jgi:hypothetical protein
MRINYLIELQIPYIRGHEILWFYQKWHFCGFLNSWIFNFLLKNKINKLMQSNLHLIAAHFIYSMYIFLRITQRLSINLILASGHSLHKNRRQTADVSFNI